MSRPSAAKFNKTNGPRNISNVQQSSAVLAPTVQPDYQGGAAPFYSTGARAFIRVGGQAIGVAQSFSWKVSYSGNPVNTIDAVEPWDIDVGRLNISGSLSQIIDPTKGPEADGLFAIMQAAIHQPMVEIQVLDALGTSLFFARGMFLAVNGNVSRGQVSNLSAEFLGVVYQHYVNQGGFTPYGSVAGAASKIAKNLRNLASDLTGGIL